MFVTAFETRTWAYGVLNAPMVVVDKAISWESPRTVADIAAKNLDAIIAALTKEPKPYKMTPEVENFLKPQPKVIKFEGKDTYQQFDEFFRKRLWSAGLPLVPPTKERVEAMLKGTKRNRNEVIAVLDLLRGKATVEKIAINAVMAGCKPEELPLLIAVVKAMEDPYEKKDGGTGYAGEDYLNAAGLLGTANPGEIHVLVAGPIVKKLNIGSVRGAWAPHAETSNNRIGYAVRLIISNIGGNNYYLNQSKAIGQAGAMTQFLRAEAPAEVMTPGLRTPMKNPWTPLQVTLGYKPEDSIVFVYDGQFPAHAGGNNPLNNTRAKDQLEKEIIPSILPFVTEYRERGGVLILSNHQAQQFVEAGYSKEFVLEMIYKHTKLNQKFMYGKPRKEPGDLFITVGGSAGAQNAFVPMGHGHWNVEKIEE